MTEFIVTKIEIPSADLNGESSLPALDNIPLKTKKHIIDLLHYRILRSK